MPPLPYDTFPGFAFAYANASGTVLAALNVGAQAARVSVKQLEKEFLPVLLKGAQELSILLP